jgi:hypothetical protein
LTPGTVAQPLATPPASEVSSGTLVTLSTATEGATIYYTLDGTEPDSTKTRYTGQITITSALTIKAIAVKEGLTNSGVLTAAYTISQGITVSLVSAIADGNVDTSEATTKITLTFDKPLSGVTPTLNDVGVIQSRGGSANGVALIKTSSTTYDYYINAKSENYAQGVLALQFGGSEGYLKTVKIENGVKQNIPVVYGPFAPYTITNIAANGDNDTVTSKLDITFDREIPWLTQSDIQLIYSGGNTFNHGTQTELTHVAGTKVYTLTLDTVRLADDGKTIKAQIKKTTGDTTMESALSAMSATLRHPQINAALKSVTANGSSTATTNELTLTFDKEIAGLTADNITLTGAAAKSGSLTHNSGTSVYTLPVTVTANGTATAAVTPPDGYTISGSPVSNIAVYYYMPLTDVNLISITDNGGGTATTTQLILTFDKEITGLTADNITLEGDAAKSGNLAHNSGTFVYTLPVTVTANGTATVTVTVPAGFTITGSPKGVTVYYCVKLTSITANGSGSTTTQLTLTFDKEITGFTTNNITLAGAAIKSGNLAHNSGTSVYTLPIITLTGGGTVTATVTVPDGLIITGSPKDVTLHYNAQSDYVEESVTTTTPPTTWMVSTIPEMASYITMNTVAYKKGVGFVIGSGTDYNKPAFAISTTGTGSWTVKEITNVQMFDSFAGKIRRLNNRFIATRGSGPKCLIISDDGINWAEVSISFGTKGFAYGNNVYLIAGQKGQAAYSTDNMETWTTVPASATGFSTNGNQGYLNAAAYGNGKFVIGGGGGETAVSTNNGQTWTHCEKTGNTSPQVIFDGGFIDSMVFFDNKFIALGGTDGGDAKSAYSTDGLTWTQGGAPGLKTNSDTSPMMAIGGGYIVAVDLQGKASYSQDGISWTSIADTGFDAMNGIKDVTYGNGRFVIVGANGRTAYCDIK